MTLSMYFVLVSFDRAVGSRSNSFVDLLKYYEPSLGRSLKQFILQS